MIAGTENVRACKSKGCKRPYRAKGYCNVHYRKWRRGELEKKGRYRICTEEKCRKATFKKGYCEQHYSAWSASKKPQAAAEAKPAAAAPVAAAPAEVAKPEEKPAEEVKV
jgi:hypothetical protein